MKALFRELNVTAILLLYLGAEPAYAAACSNPAGNEGDQTYNRDYHTMQFCDGTNWVDMGGMGTGGALTFISTQAASHSLGLQFTGIGTYNTRFLNCTDLLLDTDTSHVNVQLAEGAAPTWNNGGHYTTFWLFSGASQELHQTIAADGINVGINNQSNAKTRPQSFKMFIDNVGSPPLHKYFTIDSTFYASAPYGYRIWGYWSNDTNPITAIQVISNSGYINSGQCSLYGMD